MYYLYVSHYIIDINNTFIEITFNILFYNILFVNTIDSGQYHKILFIVANKLLYKFVLTWLLHHVLILVFSTYNTWSFDL